MTDTELDPTTFEPGSKPDGDTIPLCVPQLDGCEAENILECVETGWVSSAGDYVDTFEDRIADHVGTDHAVATVNGTAALHTALRTLGIGDGDEVLVSGLTFIAPANAVRYVGARPAFVDAEPDHLQMDTEALTAFIEDRCSRRNGELVDHETGQTVRAILCVHLLGHPCELDALRSIADEHDLTLVEDASQALGVEYHDEHVGTVGDVACLSFNGNKTITAGGGGMIVTDDAGIAQRAHHLTTQAKADPVEYVHDEIGYNYRLPNVNAALGCAQLDQIDEIVRAKREIAHRYIDAFADREGVRVVQEPENARSTYWLNAIEIDPDQAGIDRRTLAKRLEEHGIQTRPLWQPMDQSPAHESRESSPVAHRLNERVLCLPSSAGLERDDQAYVIDCVQGEVRNS